MTKNPRPYDHLRRNVPMTVALLAGLAATAMPVLSATFVFVPHGYMAGRGTPLYWLIMLPVAYWAWGIISFDAWAVRLLAPLLIVAPLTDALFAVFSPVSGDDVTALWVLAALSLVFAVVGAIALRRTPLWPFDRAKT